MKLKNFFVSIAIALLICSCSGDDKVENLSVPDQERHPYGQPQVIIQFTENKPTVIDHDAIAPLLDERLADYKIAVYSIVGDYGIGKSFLMDYCLRFLYANFKSLNFLDNPLTNKTNWMGDKDEVLTGFSWTPGKNNKTSGIVMWSDIFLHESPSGEKIAIVLMDTQGLFDLKENFEESSKIYVLNSIISSYMIFYTKDPIEKKEIKLLTRYMKSNQPDLMFLIRDWQRVRDHPFGLEGGTKYVGETFKASQKYYCHREGYGYLWTIFCIFEDINGFLLPSAGDNIATDPKYKGHWSGMDPEFKENFQELIETFFAPENIKAKRISDQYFNGSQYYDYLKAHCNVFQSKTIPEMENIYFYKLWIIIEEVVEQSIKELEIYRYIDVKSDPDILNILKRDYKIAKQNVVDSVMNIKKMEYEDILQKWNSLITAAIDEKFNRWDVIILNLTNSMRCHSEPNEIKQDKLDKIIKTTKLKIEEVEQKYEKFESGLNDQNEKLWEVKKQENFLHHEQLEPLLEQIQWLGHILYKIKDEFNGMIADVKKRHNKSMTEMENRKKREDEQLTEYYIEKEKKINATIQKMIDQNLKGTKISRETFDRLKLELELEQQWRNEYEDRRQKLFDDAEEHYQMEIKYWQEKQEKQLEFFKKIFNNVQSLYEQQVKKRPKMYIKREKEIDNLSKKLTAAEKHRKDQIEEIIKDFNEHMEELKAVSISRCEMRLENQET